MYLSCALLGLIAGYLLLVYASKQSGFLTSIGTFIAWLVMVVSIAGLGCGIYKYVKHGFHGKGHYGGHYCKYKKYKKHYRHHYIEKEIEITPESGETSPK